jgi:chemotaxis protein histidine kinase CheA
MNELTREQKMEAARVRMAELAAKFLERSDADIQSMRAGLARLASGDAAALGEVRHLAHRMAGTGATLGFEPLSELARRLEQLADGCEDGAIPDESARSGLAGAVDALAGELVRQRGG